MGVPQEFLQPPAPQPKHTDYTNLLGGNLVTKEQQMSPPTKPEDYVAYRQGIEHQMAETTRQASWMTQQGFVCTSVMCEHQNSDGSRREYETVRGPDGKPITKRIWKHKEGHMNGVPGFACDHVICADATNPEDVFMVPFERGDQVGYLLCATCFNLLEHFRLNIGKFVMAKCSVCCLEALEKLTTKNPNKFHDLRMKRS